MNTGVSVIILTSGQKARYHHIEKLLISLSKQTFKDFELILATERVDKDLVNIFRKYFCPCKEHRILVTGYWNRCKTANKAIMESHGDIVILLEDDLILKRNFLDQIIKPFQIDLNIGCVYSRCIWVYREGLRSRSGIVSLIAKLVSKLSIHGSILQKQVKRIDKYLYEVPVFTMSVACKREALYKAGLYDEDAEEPILGEDYDLALRIRKRGYKILLNTKAVSFHFTRQVTKRIMELHRDTNFLRGIYKSEVLFIVKNRNMLGFYVLSHIIHRIIESLWWSIKVKDIRVFLNGLRGIVEGLIKGSLKNDRKL